MVVAGVSEVAGSVVSVEEVSEGAGSVVAGAGSVVAGVGSVVAGAGSVDSAGYVVSVVESPPSVAYKAKSALILASNNC